LPLHRLFRLWIVLVLILVISQSFEVDASIPILQQEDTDDVPTLVARFGDGIVGTAVEWISDTQLAVGGTVGVWLYDVSGLADEYPPAEYPRTLMEHDGGVADLAISADRSRLVSVGNGAVRVWDVATQTLMTELTGWDAVALNPDGTLLAAGNSTGSFDLWNLAPDGTATSILSDMESLQTLGRLEFSADGAWLAASTIGDDGCMSPGATFFNVWRVEALLAGNTEPHRHETVDNTGNPFILSPDSQTLVYSAYDMQSGGGVRLIALETGSMMGLDGGMIDALFYRTPDELLYRKINQGTVEWWQWLAPDFISGVFESVDSFRYNIDDLQLSPDGQRLAIASGSTVEIIDANNHLSISTITDSADVSGADIFGDSVLMTNNTNGSDLIERLRQFDDAVLLSEDGSTRVRRTSGTEYHENGYDTIFTFEDSAGELLSSITFGPADAVLSTALSPDGTWFAAVTEVSFQPGCGSERLRLWNTRTGEAVTELSSIGGHLTFNADSSLLAFSEGERIRLVNPSTGEEIANWHAAADSITALAFDVDNQMLIAQSVDGTVSFWEL
jgi:WD40 repeat protein